MRQLERYVVLCFAIVFTFTPISAKAAFPIQINTGAYSGFWDVLGVTSGLTGDQTIQLDEGSYFVRVARDGNAAVLIDVDAAGNVSSQNSAAISASGDTLTFNTTTISIDPGAYNGSSNFWDVLNVTNGLTGAHNVTLVPNLNYFVRVARNGNSAVAVNVDAAGNVTSQNSAAMIASGNTLTFNTATISVNPGAYNGSSNFWDVLNVTSGLTGIHNVTVVPNLVYFVRVARNGNSAVAVNVDAAGNVTSQNTDAMTASGNLITFNTTMITVDPGAYDNPSNFWDVLNVTNGLTGIQNVTLVPNLLYFVRVARNGNSAVAVNVDAAGNVTSQNTAAMNASGNLVTFNTTSISIDPGAYDGPSNFWDVLNVTGGLTGSQNVTLVPNLLYFIRIARNGNSAVAVNVDAAGNATSQNTAAISAVGNMLTFNSTTIQITPSTTNTWKLLNATGNLTGASSLSLVPGVGYFLSSGSTVFFTVAEPCAINPNQFVAGGTTFDLSCGLPDADSDRRS